jgi:acetylornithine deacetylase
MKFPGELEENFALSRLQNVIRIPSVTGNEDELANYLYEELRNLKPDVLKLQKGSSFRSNVIAVFKGEDEDALLLIAHLDTVSTKGWTEYWTGKDETRCDPHCGVLVEGNVWGRGASDTKGGIATVISAIELIRESNQKQKKTIVVAFVSDEESGEIGLGLSLGIKAAIPFLQGLDVCFRLAIYLEPTKLDIYVAQMGFQIVDITVKGKTAYFGRPELGIDALKITHDILSALWKLNDELISSESHELIGESNLLVTSVSSGGLIAVPGNSSISLIRKLIPGESLEVSADRLRGAIESVSLTDGASLDIQFSASRDHPTGGTAIENEINSDLISLQEIIKNVSSDAGNFVGAPYWSEAPIVNAALGIPCVYWAGGDISVCHTPEEHIEFKQYKHAIVSLARFMELPWPTM